MYKALHILLVMLFVATGAAAQRMPERAQVRKGTREYHKGNYEEAIKRYGTALTLAPGQFEATYDLGNALYKAEMYDRAEQTMMQAAADTLRSDAERAEAWYNLGNARFKQQKYQEALESYRQSLRLNPDDMEAKYNYAYTKQLLDKNNQGGGISRDSRIRTRTRIKIKTRTRTRTRIRTRTRTVSRTRSRVKDSRTRSRTRSRVKATGSPSRAASRSRSSSRSSTPSRRRRTARRRSSRRSRASSSGAGKTGKHIQPCTSHHHTTCGCSRSSSR